MKCVIVAVLIGILFVTQCNCGKGSCGPEMTWDVVTKFEQLCPYSYSAFKRDVNQGFWYYKLNRIESERGTNELSNGGIRRPADNPWLIKNSYRKSKEEVMMTPWQTWFKLASPPPSSPAYNSKYERSLDLAQIEMLVDPLNNGGSETDMPIARWRRLQPELFMAILEFINDKCCKNGCEFPDDYLPFAKDKDMFKMLGC